MPARHIALTNKHPYALGGVDIKFQKVIFLFCEPNSCRSCLQENSLSALITLYKPPFFIIISLFYNLRKVAFFFFDNFYRVWNENPPHDIFILVEIQG